MDKTDILRRLDALAAPVRRDLYDVLLVRGDLSSSDLRRLVPEAKTSLAYELSRLQDAGLIDLVEHIGRHKVWRAVAMTIAWDDALRGDPDLVRALNNFERVATTRRAERMHRWLQEKMSGAWPSRWLDSAMSTDFLLQLTPAELSELDEAIFEAVDAVRKRSDARRQTGSDDEQSPVFVCAMAFPLDPTARS